MQTKKKNLMDKSVEQDSELKIRNRRIRLIDVAIFVAAGLTAFGFWTHDVIAGLLLIPLIILIPQLLIINLHKMVMAISPLPIWK